MGSIAVWGVRGKLSALGSQLSAGRAVEAFDFRPSTFDRVGGRGGALSSQPGGWTGVHDQVQVQDQVLLGGGAEEGVWAALLCGGRAGKLSALGSRLSAGRAVEAFDLRHSTFDRVGGRGGAVSSRLSAGRADGGTLGSQPAGRAGGVRAFPFLRQAPRLHSEVAVHWIARLALVTGLALLAAAPGAAGIDFKPDFAVAEFRDLSEAIADALVFPNLGPASSGGIVGFEVLAAAGGPRVKTSSRWWRYGVNGSTTAGIMAAGRGVVRKGLPLRLDAGLQYGTLLGERFWGAELRWALLAGGVLEPAVALRASHSRIEFGSHARFAVSEAQLVVSKGFALLTPYVAGGYRRVESRAFFGDPVSRLWTMQAERWTAAAGVRFNLLPFRFVGEVRRGFSTSVFAGVGVGL